MFINAYSLQRGCTRPAQCTIPPCMCDTMFSSTDSFCTVSHNMASGTPPFQQTQGCFSHFHGTVTFPLHPGEYLVISGMCALLEGVWTSRACSLFPFVRGGSSVRWGSRRRVPRSWEEWWWCLFCERSCQVLPTWGYLLTSSARTAVSPG